MPQWRYRRRDDDWWAPSVRRQRYDMRPYYVRTLDHEDDLNDATQWAWQVWSMDDVERQRSRHERRIDGWEAWIREENIRIPRAAVDELAQAVRLAEQNQQQGDQAICRARARELLIAHLDERQRIDFELHQYFRIVVPSGRQYQIRLGRSGNVDEIDDRGRPLARYCAHPAAYVPDEDTVLAQKLMLECAEDEFLRIANVHQRWAYNEETGGFRMVTPGMPTVEVEPSEGVPAAFPLEETYPLDETDAA